MGSIHCLRKQRERLSFSTYFILNTWSNNFHAIFRFLTALLKIILVGAWRPLHPPSPTAPKPPSLFLSVQGSHFTRDLIFRQYSMTGTCRSHEDAPEISRNDYRPHLWKKRLPATATVRVQHKTRVCIPMTSGKNLFNLLFIQHIYLSSHSLARSVF